MIRATIAEQNMMLCGCDTMHHADKAALFPCIGEHTDFCMTVKTVAAVAPLDGEIFGRGTNTRWVRTEDGRRAVVHEKGHFSLTYNDDFSDVTFTIDERHPQRTILQYLYVSQNFKNRMLITGGCSLHSAGLSVGGNGVALCGRSGCGKSTLAHHWTAQNGDIHILCEDAPAVRWRDEQAVLYGTMFCGDDDECANDTAPLRAIVMLEKSTENRLVTPAASKRMFLLLDAVNRPVYSSALGETAVDRVNRLIDTVPIVQFYHDGTPRATAFLQDALAREGWI